MYEEIKKLKKYCDKIRVIATPDYIFGYCAYVLWFENGGYCIQHNFSSGSEDKKVEFGSTGTRLDYKSTTLVNAKAFVKRNKDKLNNAPF